MKTFAVSYMPSLFCGGCGYALYTSTAGEHNERLVAECFNPDCERHNIKLKVPHMSMVLECDEPT